MILNGGDEFEVERKSNGEKKYILILRLAQIKFSNY